MPCLSCCWRKTEDLKGDSVEEDEDAITGYFLLVLLVYNHTYSL